MNWKNKWKKELNSVVPKLSDTVLNTPTEKVEIKSERVKSRRKFISFGALSFAAVLVLTLVVGFYLLQPPTVPETVFAVEINPAAAFVLDKNDKVKSVTAINSDADVILSSEENLNEIIGKSANQAVEKFVDIAAKYGYIDLSDITGQTTLAAVRISSCGAKNFESLRASVESFLSGKGIPSVVFTQKVEERDFYDIIGIEKEQGVKLVDTVKNSPVLYAEKNIDENNITEKFHAYGNELLARISDEHLKKSIEEYLQTEIFNISQYVENIKGLLDIEKNSRIEHLGKYLQFEILNKDNEISKDKLDEKHREILDQNGSFNDFWNDRKNNGKK